MANFVHTVWQKTTRFIMRINVFVAILLAVVTLVAYLAVFVKPETCAVPAIVGMGFPYILIVDVLYALLLIFFKKWTALLMLAVLIPGYEFIDATVQVNPIHYVEDFDDDDSTFSIMSFNVRLLDRYNWIKGKNDTRTKIFEFLRYESPDVVCFQEFYNNSSDSITNEMIIQDLLGTSYIVRDYNPDDKKHSTNKGYRIFSKYPLGKVSPIFDQTDNLIGIYADAQVLDRKVRIMNFHLKSIKLGYDDYDFIDQIEQKNNKEQMSGVMNIYSKISKAYSIRTRQAEIIRGLVEQSPYAVVLCADFNDPPVSYCYRTIKGNTLTDAFCESGTGFGGTIRVKFLNFRIDYIMHSPVLESRNFKTFRENLSDHYAVSCKIKI